MGNDTQLRRAEATASGDFGATVVPVPDSGPESGKETGGVWGEDGSGTQRWEWDEGKEPVRGILAVGQPVNDFFVELISETTLVLFSNAVLPSVEWVDKSSSMAG